MQQQMRLFPTVEAYGEETRRFLSAAANKRAGLVVFPELAGTMATLPLLHDFSASLLKLVDTGRRRSASRWQRTVGSLAHGVLGMTGADLHNALGAQLDVAGDQMWTRYAELFSGLARDFGVTIVAPSAYLPDPHDRVVRNLSAVFGPRGNLLGTQAKVMLSRRDDLVKPGESYTVIATEVGQLGVIIGEDVMYPEVGRALAFQGAEMLIAQSAATHVATYNKLRTGMLARMQDNQLYGAVSFLVGENKLSVYGGETFMGRSAIFAPQELTPRYNGVLVEMGSYRVEGVLAAEWDFAALRKLRAQSDAPVHKSIGNEQVGHILTRLYNRLQRLAGQIRLDELPEPSSVHEVDAEINGLIAPPGRQRERPLVTLNQLSAVSSVVADWSQNGGALKNMASYSPAPTPASTYAFEPDPDNPANSDDETDEMDALPGSSF